MKIRSAPLATARALWLAIFGLIQSLTLFTLAIVSVALVPVGIGVLAVPPVFKLVRAYANQRRAQAKAWSGVEIPVPYLPLPKNPNNDFLGYVALSWAVLKDKATWRDLQWLLIDSIAGFILAVLPVTFFLYALWGPVLALGVWKPIARHGGLWFGFIHITDQTSANYAAALGLAVGVLGLFVNPGLLRANFLLARSVLSPTHERELAQRVEHLTETRHDAVDTSAAELRRIERDLHDGAQARLVAVGMSLGTIEALMEKDPAQARQLLAAARESSAEALTELRDLVRGIHPPVLAERGFGDAVRALALRLPLPVEVDIELPGRAAEPVEAAAYFAVSEILTNAVKHSGARGIWLDAHHTRGMLRITITDNGRGGAEASRGSGLLGVERRLGAFDGIMAVNSPAGGPTMVTIEIPCTLAPRA